MFNVEVTLLKEQGVGKKRVEEFEEALNYGWLDVASMTFVEDSEGCYHYFNSYEVQSFKAKEIEQESPLKLV